MLAAGFAMVVGITACQQKSEQSSADEAINNPQTDKVTIVETSPVTTTSTSDTSATADNTETTTVITVTETNTTGSNCGSSDDNTDEESDNS